VPVESLCLRLRLRYYCDDMQLLIVKRRIKTKLESDVRPSTRLISMHLVKSLAAFVRDFVVVNFV